MITQAGWARKSHWISGVDPCIVKQAKYLIFLSYLAKINLELSQNIIDFDFGNYICYFLEIGIKKLIIWLY